MADLYRTGKQYADQAKDKKYEKLTYDNVDCQAFCELVLKDIGVRKSNGTVYNWKGSNDIARNACSWIGTKEECIAQFGFIPLGAWAFIWDNTGNEKQRGYYDGLGNYSHIGIYVGDNVVRDSTRYKDSKGNYVRNGPANRALSAFLFVPGIIPYKRPCAQRNKSELLYTFFLCSNPRTGISRDIV